MTEILEGEIVKESQELGQKSIQQFNWMKYFLGAWMWFAVRPFYNKIARAIRFDGFEHIGIWGPRGIGKSTLMYWISYFVYGSWPLALKFTVTNRYQIYDLVDEVKSDPRFWVMHRGIWRKRIPLLNFDDQAADQSATKSNTSEDQEWNIYDQVLRSDVAVIIGSMPGKTDLKRRQRLGLTGEVGCYRVKRRNFATGLIEERRIAQALEYIKRPDFKRHEDVWETKRVEFTKTWPELPLKVQRVVKANRDILTAEYREKARGTLKAKARILAGIAGKAEEHLDNEVVDNLLVALEVSEKSPSGVFNQARYNAAYRLKYPRVRYSQWMYGEMMATLGAQRLVTMKASMDGHMKKIQLTNLGKMVIEARKSPDEFLSD